MGRDLIVDAEITQLSPPNVWAFKASSGPMKFEETDKFESKDDGTLLVRSFNAEIGGFFKIAEGLAVKQLQKQIEADSNTLKALLEAK